MNSSASRPLNRSGWLILAAALVLLLGNVAQLAYRFTLPTDGWWVTIEEIVKSNFLLYRNLVGAESALQSNDVLLEMD